MAPNFLTVKSSLQCPHGGAVNSSTSNTRVKASRSIVLRSTDTFLIDGCTHTIANIPHPCVRVEWNVHAERHTTLGDPSLTEDSVGYCLAADDGMQGSVVISSTQIQGAAS